MITKKLYTCKKNIFIKYYRKLFNVIEKNLLIKNICNAQVKKLFTSSVFPRALPLRLGESTFTVPPAHP